MDLGKYHIFEEIGHGGFGTVYRANDTTLDRIVALKVLHEQYLSDQKFIESFKREARMMARVSHPNVVQLFEVGDLEGQIYIAMQYFDAGNLDQRIQAGGPLPLKDAIRMLSQTARGLEAGHKIGLVHRDVKPANILYNREGYIAISDFGVAKSIQQSSPETTNSFNQFAGTPYYIPPELWKSEGNPSPAADVYSLACVFYEALTGEILFAGDTYEHVLTRHVLEAPVFSKALPECLVDTLNVALAKNPSDRYQTMNDFLAAVRGALEGQARTPARTETAPEQTSGLEELPKPLAPGEITFDELVRRSQHKTSAQGPVTKPAPISQPTPPPVRPVIPTPQPQIQQPLEEAKVRPQTPADATTELTSSASDVTIAESNLEGEVVVEPTSEIPREAQSVAQEDRYTQAIRQREESLAHNEATSRFDQARDNTAEKATKKKPLFVFLFAFGGIALIALATLALSGQARNLFASLFSNQPKAPAIVPTGTSTSTEAPIVAESPVVEESTEAPTILTVVTYFDQLQNLSPFFNSTGAEEDIINLTQLSLLTTDRQGMVVENAIVGETRPFNGTPYTYTGPADVDIEFNTSTGNTLYTFTLRPDLKFSDGVPVSADDLIFTLYTFLDPSFDGQNDIAYLPVLGLQDYRTQTTPEIYEKYDNLFTLIYNSGENHVRVSSDPWTRDQQVDVWNRLEVALANEVEKIVNYVVSNYTDGYVDEYFGFSAEEVYANEGLQVAYGMRMWGFAEENTTTKIMTGSYSGKTWDLNYEFPTQSDFSEEILLCYDDDYRAAFPYESPDGTDVYQEVKQDFINYWGPLDPNMVGGVPNIRGVNKISDTTITVELEGFATNWIYSLDIPIIPLHYYGNTDKYNYALNMFGFDFGDLSPQHSKDFAPFGAGPYQFEPNMNYLEANRYYYKGDPKIDKIMFAEDTGQSLPGAISSGSMDLAFTYFNQIALTDIYNINSNGELAGDVITASQVENPGYGYIGINARTVKVGNDPSSTASCNLRKALSTILAVHRKPAIEAYYGVGGATTLEYPTILSSWASPQPADPGYQEAFSVDINGNPIYSPGMSQEQRVAAAKNAALGFFEAAGFTVSGGKVRVAPIGAMLEYECIVPGGGTGDHPAYGILVAAQETLSEIGIALKVNDPADPNVLWDAIDNGTQELWTSAWSSDIDPDLYTSFHSFNVFDQPNGNLTNHYYIQDPELDSLIVQASTSDVQVTRKQLYQQAFDIIMDWAVVIPTYNRNNFVLFSTQRIDTSTITPDITPFWDWQNDIENMRMK